MLFWCEMGYWFYCIIFIVCIFIRWRAARTNGEWNKILALDRGVSPTGFFISTHHSLLVTNRTRGLKRRRIYNNIEYFYVPIRTTSCLHRERAPLPSRHPPTRIRGRALSGGGEGGGYSYILNITQIESALSCTYLTLPESLNPFAKGLLSIFNRVIWNKTSIYITVWCV